ncbi:peptidylprolyl isomerase [Seongchinamella unica]|nr:peptidylprolyl isomerase [Seongchinamella unica]
MLKCLFSALLLVVPALPAMAQNIVVQDGEFALTESELAYLVSRWTQQMRDSAIGDDGDRLELLNLSLANKKLAAEAENIAEQDPDVTWQYRLGLEAYQRDFALRWYRDQVEVPDFTELAQEQYTLNRDKYALIPERRISSHILFSAPPGVVRDDLLVKAQGVLDQLREGADFVEMVETYSGEPGAAEKQGKFDRWLKFGEIGVTPPYTEGLFTIEKIGDYSELVQTEFGIHIIRLDGIQEQSYKSFEDVKDDIVKELEAEYIQLAMKDYVGQFNMSDDVIIDHEAVEAILAPYAKQE